MSEKEVYYSQYCRQCEYYKQPEAADPCDECLAQPVNEDSHKPLYFKKAKKPPAKERTAGCIVQKAPKNEWTYRSQS